MVAPCSSDDGELRVVRQALNSDAFEFASHCLRAQIARGNTASEIAADIHPGMMRFMSWADTPYLSPRIRHRLATDFFRKDVDMSEYSGTAFSRLRYLWFQWMENKVLCWQLYTGGLIVFFLLLSTL